MDAAEGLGDRFGDLPRSSRRLIRLMQTINYGRITIPIRAGEPDPAQAWRTQQTVKLVGGENGPRPEVSCADFTLCNDHKALLSELKRLPDGVRVTIEVKRGLPLFIEIDQDCVA